MRALLAGAAAGRLIREGCRVVVLGRPNVGKSSVFNRLLGSSRAIVTPFAGTTRDLVTETVDLDGLAVSLVDSAGLRPTGDPVEAEGVSRARRAFGSAAAGLVVVDRSEALAADDRAVLAETAGSPRVVVVNKVDLPEAWPSAALPVDDDAPRVEVSARTGHGFDRLRGELRRVLVGGPAARETPMVTNLRHIELLDRAGSGAGGRGRGGGAGGGRGIRAGGPAARAERAGGADRETDARRCAPAHLRPVLHREVTGDGLKPARAGGG